MVPIAHFSHGARVGSTIHLGAAAGVDAGRRLAGTTVGVGDMAAQAEQLFANLHLALEALGGTWQDVVKVRTYIVDWRDLPAYLVAPGSAMKLVERRRGDADPAPDELVLERTLWLDFDGRGYTAHDAISGRLSRSWRLEMAEPVVLGRVAIDGTSTWWISWARSTSPSTSASVSVGRPIMKYSLIRSHPASKARRHAFRI